MNEKIKTPDEQPNVLEMDTLIGGEYKLGPDEVVFVKSNLKDSDTFTINDLEIPYSYVAGIRLGNEQSNDEFHVLYVQDPNKPDQGTFFVRNADQSQEGWRPVPLFNIRDNGPGILGKEGKPTRDHKLATVSFHHVQLFSKGNLLGVKNLQPQSDTVVFRVQSTDQ